MAGNLLSSSTSSSSSSKSSKKWHSVSGYFGPVDDITQANKDKYGQEWQQSDRVADLYNQYQAAQQNRPEFNSTYKGQVENIYNQIQNRDQFNYNFNADKLYQQYAEQYKKIGKQGMQDSIQEAAKMAGGYGNTYAKTAGQQQYQKYLTSINNVLPELYDMAYKKYSDETKNLYNQYGIASDLYNTEYNQYRDQVGDWKSDREFATDMYRNERNFDYGKWTDSRKFWQDEYWKQRKAVKESWGEEETKGEESGTSTTTNMYEDPIETPKASEGSGKTTPKGPTRNADLNEAHDAWAKDYAENKDKHITGNSYADFLLYELNNKNVSTEFLIDQAAAWDEAYSDYYSENGQKSILQEVADYLDPPQKSKTAGNYSPETEEEKKRNGKKKK